MDKTALISMFITFVASNDVLKYEPHTAGNLENGRVTSSWNKPKFCNGLDCPEYKTVKTTKDYEERIYSESRWVSTNLTGIDYKVAQYQMFMKLFKYIGGNNEGGKKIDMTCPVTDRIIPAQGPACKSNFIMSFYIAPKVTTAPLPKDKTVYLETKSDLHVYVRQFGGFTDDFEAWRKHAEELGIALRNDGLAYEEAYYFTAGYDAPFKLFNRHNEIWFLKK
ncbi:heme-binding protein 2-like [Mercenaria mercenaria]|uniref:heme-binding protein 2-like n=1 Tax=Mercenaria mercenaria TaxID=6596 RepID=UPI001E1D9877|nr:heme-binding protein 2-like [Mercenaria mercenaria]